MADYRKQRDNLIKRYFHMGLNYNEILAYLSLTHDIQISYRQLKRILREYCLFRRRNYTPLQEVVEFVDNEVQLSGRLHGYRWMHHKCLQNGLIVTQDTVRQTLHVLDPVGIALRKRNRLRRRQYRNKGPNFLWHVDSYDKLKPYGICINGCIDGFSRHIMWLKAGYTSSDPKIIGGYYLNTIETLGGCPRTIRSDMGTENGILENLQTHIRNALENEIPAFIYGKSQANQKIESWWSILRKQKTQFWMNFFQILKEDGHFDGSWLDKSLIQFCFMEIIQGELDKIVLEWNTHSIRPSRNTLLPSGRPSVMFDMPELYGTKNYLIQKSAEEIDELKEFCKIAKRPCDKTVYELCNTILSEEKMSFSNDPYEALNLFIFLKNKIVEEVRC